MEVKLTRSVVRRKWHRTYGKIITSEPVVAMEDLQLNLAYYSKRINRDKFSDISVENNIIILRVIGELIKTIVIN